MTDMDRLPRSGKDRGLLRLKARPVGRRDRWTWLKTGWRPEPEPAKRGVLEAPNAATVGICCSGGGIRSAAFNLGALQELDRQKLLRRADYLAAVSGGSYVAAAMTMVAKTAPRGSSRDDSDPDLLREHGPFAPGSPEEQYLRNRCSYLAPDGTRKLFLFYRVLLGLVFNLLFLGLPLFALGVGLGSLVYEPGYGVLDGDMTVARWAFWTLVAAGMGCLVAGATVLLARLANDRRRMAAETWTVRLLLIAAGLFTLLYLVPLAVEVIRDYGDRGDGQASARAGSAVGTAGIVSLLVAVLAQLRARLQEPATVLKDVKGVGASLRKLAPRVRTALVALVGAVVGPLLLLGFLVAGAAIAAAHWSTAVDLAVAVVGTLAFGGLYFVCDLNAWSLHPFYKRRLCSAFALKRVNEGDRPVARERDYDRLVPLSKTNPDDWPTLLVCAAANISDPGATPPGRGVTTFTFSHTAIGGPLVGAMPAEEYEAWLGKNRQRDITLPAAVAMSGAALSPSMGKMTRRAFTFLMALANVRLGVWVPNPRHVENWSKQRQPIGDDCRPTGLRDRRRMPRPSYLLRELLGKNRVDAPFLYVSDGGHYENLGLVELLRRGCTTIYCFDASGGTSFEALGDAIALARSELDVEIDIDPRPLVPTGDRQLATSDCVVGKITYPGSRPNVGRLVYARTVVTKDLPWDVHAYHEGDKTFPHHSTADQLYTDQRFEAYRALGEWAGKHAIAALHATQVLKAAEATVAAAADPLAAETE